MTHWADVVAAELMERHGDAKQVFATAITPSGPIHVGNMREVLTTEAIFRATVEAGGDAELLYIADDYDPLRKVYPFLEDKPNGIDFAAHVGKPLREIPAPGDGESYAHHFLAPFLDNLRDLGIQPTVHSAYDLYHEGRYVDTTVTALDQADQVRGIIETVSKRQLPKNWAPFNPQCPTCRTLAGVEVLAYQFPELHCRCTACAAGTEDPEAGAFTADVRTGGIGKLPWRVDWPARWKFFGVTFEAFGKDHGAAGGSWDSGTRLVREVFDGREPHHVMYEFLNLKGQGAMHSSTGLAISATDVLRMTPPEVLRYLLMRQSPRKHIDFDPGLGVLNLVDEFDRLERIQYGAEENPGTFTEVERTYQLSCPGPVPKHLPRKVAYRHLVTVVQMPGAETLAGVEAVLRRSGELTGDLDDADRALLADRVHHVRYWLGRFAPDAVRFQVQDALPDYPFTADDRAFLRQLVAALEAADWNGQAIHDAVYEAKGERNPGTAFKAIYQAILGQDRGPRAGFFLASLERDWVLDRLGAAAS
jgi:lysyl-tRNA synthetase, class I